jgi:RNase P subunit RPR2
VQIKIGIALAQMINMRFFCRHCDQIVFGRAYRVISQENGVVLLDMTVCRSCYEQARALGLHSEAIPLERNPHSERRQHGGTGSVSASG